MIKSEAHSQHEIIDSVNAKLVQALADTNKALSAANETILQQQGCNIKAHIEPS